MTLPEERFLEERLDRAKLGFPGQAGWYKKSTFVKYVIWYINRH